MGRFKLKIDQEIPREFLENRFDLRIDRAKLCDGGYNRELVTPDKERPKPPAKCLAVRRRDLLQNYARPQVGGTLAQLFVQAKRNELIGCKAFIIIGFDAPRT